MEESHRKVLQKWRLTISRNINVEKVTEELFTGGVLDKNDHEEILAQTTTEKQALRLLDLLPRRGSQAFPDFKQALRGSGCGSIVNAIQLELGRSELFDLCTQIKCVIPLGNVLIVHRQPVIRKVTKKHLRSLIIH